MVLAAITYGAGGALLASRAGGGGAGGCGHPHAAYWRNLRALATDGMWFAVGKATGNTPTKRGYDKVATASAVAAVHMHPCC